MVSNMKVIDYVRDEQGAPVFEGYAFEDELSRDRELRWVSVVIELTPAELASALDLIATDWPEFEFRQDDQLVLQSVDYHGDGAESDLLQDRKSHERFLALGQRLQELAASK